MKIFIIHFNPVSLYPPTQNLIDFLGEKGEKVKVSTTSTPLSTDKPYDCEITYVVKRKELGGFIHILKFIYFNIHTLCSMIRFKPDVVFYYESISALPCIYYKKYINKHISIVCHYHEISSNENIKNESRSVQIIRKIEKKHYKSFDWISQTNDLRKAIFIHDYKKYLNIDKVHILANYPPKQWASVSKSDIKENELRRFVLIGSIDVDKMYLKKFCTLLEHQGFAYKFDVYSFYINANTLDYINAKKHVAYKGKISYQQIPSTLKDYDIGVILYNPTDTDINFIYNAPNKLFEYHICGLDVLFPSKMLYSKKYVTQMTYPVIKNIDFERNEEINIQALLNKKDLKKAVLNVNAESEFEKLYKKVLLKRSYTK